MSDFSDAKNELFVQCPNAHVLDMESIGAETMFYIDDGYGTIIGNGSTEEDAWKNAIYNVTGIYFT